MSNACRGPTHIPEMHRPLHSCAHAGAPNLVPPALRSQRSSLYSGSQGETQLPLSTYSSPAMFGKGHSLRSAGSHQAAALLLAPCRNRLASSACFARSAAFCSCLLPVGSLILGRHLRPSACSGWRRESSRTDWLDESSAAARSCLTSCHASFCLHPGYPHPLSHTHERRRTCTQTHTHTHAFMHIRSPSRTHRQEA